MSDPKAAELEKAQMDSRRANAKAQKALAAHRQLMQAIRQAEATVRAERTGSR